MTHRTLTRRLGITLVTGALLSLPAAASAIGPDTTVLVSLPSGAATAPPDGINEVTVADGRALSSDGRYAVFIGAGDALDPGAADDADSHCYLRDTLTGATTLVDRAAGPAGAVADRSCADVAISHDGTAIAFQTSAGNLVPGDTNGVDDIYVRDVATGGVFRASVRGDGSQIPAASSGPSVSVTGGIRALRRVHVAFTTAHPVDPVHDAGAGPDAYVRRTSTPLQLAETVLASRAPGADSGASGLWLLDPSVALSGDGTRVAFTTTAAIDPLDGNDRADVYVRDTGGGSTILASRATNAGAVGNEGSSGAQISRDGTTVAFTSFATNLGGTPPPTAIQAVYVRSLVAATTTPASVRAADPGQLANGYGPVLSDDGSVVAFRSSDRDLVPGASPAAGEVYVRRLGGSPQTVVASLADGPGGAGSALDGPRSALSVNSPPAISGDGGAVLFLGRGSGVAPGVRAAAPQIYLRTLAAGTTRLISRASGPGDAPLLQETAGADMETGRSVSDNGRYVVFTARGTAFSGAADPAIEQVFRRDMLTGEVRLLSRAPDGTPGDGGSSAPSVSADGSTVAFSTFSANLGAAPERSQAVVWRAGTDRVSLVSAAPGGAAADGAAIAHGTSADGTRVVFSSSAGNLGVPVPAGSTQVWVRDLTTGTNALASRARGPAGVPLATLGVPAISADGRRVAFSTLVPDPETGDTGTAADVYVRDLVSGELFRASRPNGAASTGEGTAYTSALNADGSIVAFTALAPGLVPQDTDTTTDVFVRNLATGTTVLASRANGADGAKADAESSTPVISDDGTRVAFSSRAANLVPDDVNQAPDVFVRDLARGTTIGVNRLTGATGTLMPSRAGSPVGASPDLGCIAFTSTNPNLVAGGYRSTDFTQVYLRSVGAPCAAVTAGPGGPGATARVTLSAASLRPNRFRAGTRRGRGSTLRFTLTGAARVTAVVQRPRAGRIAAGTCRIGRRTGRKCTVWTRVARFTVQAPTGTTTRRFTAVFNRRALAPGRYRLRLTPTGGTTRTITFRITGAPR